jgi:hypothetical protein
MRTGRFGALRRARTPPTAHHTRPDISIIDEQRENARWLRRDARDPLLAGSRRILLADIANSGLDLACGEFFRRDRDFSLVVMSSDLIPESKHCAAVKRTILCVHPCSFAPRRSINLPLRFLIEDSFFERERAIPSTYKMLHYKITSRRSFTSQKEREKRVRKPLPVSFSLFSSCSFRRFQRFYF